MYGNRTQIHAGLISITCLSTKFACCQLSCKQYEKKSEQESFTLVGLKFCAFRNYCIVVLHFICVCVCALVAHFFISTNTCNHCQPLNPWKLVPQEKKWFPSISVYLSAFSPCLVITRHQWSRYYKVDFFYHWKVSELNDNFLLFAIRSWCISGADLQ